MQRELEKRSGKRPYVKSECIVVTTEMTSNLMEASMSASTTRAIIGQDLHPQAGPSRSGSAKKRTAGPSPPPKREATIPYGTTEKPKE